MFDPFTLRSLIEEHGVNVKIESFHNHSYNPVTGGITQNHSDIHVKAYFFNSDPSIVETTTVDREERRIVVSDKLLDGAETPVIKAGDIVTGFGDNVVVTRASQITSGPTKMCQLLYVKG
jgi:hypothetical protein